MDNIIILQALKAALDAEAIAKARATLAEVAYAKDGGEATTILSSFLRITCPFKMPAPWQTVRYK